VSDRKTQSYANHARYVPGYHVLLALILLLNIGYAVMHVWRHPTWPGAWVGLAMSFGFVALYYYARAFALTVQDRVIRLEETLRMERLLPPDLRGRISELTRGQFIALRFAGDSELAELTRKVLDERITDTKAIKRMVRDWRPDHLRA
jgi:hypothetical protein